MQIADHSRQRAGNCQAERRVVPVGVGVAGAEKSKLERRVVRGEKWVRWWQRAIAEPLTE